jgi:hypothetical protein
MTATLAPTVSWSLSQQADEAEMWGGERERERERERELRTRGEKR